MGLRVALAQGNPTVGDVDGNTERVLAAWRAAADAGATLVVSTELALSGYPPEDLLLKPEFVDAEAAALQRLAAQGPPGCTLLVGHVGTPGGRPVRQAAHWDVAVSARDLCNCASALRDGRVVATYRKLRLPNYGVFDEARYFTAFDEPVVVDVDGVTVGLTVCEDLWTEEGPLAASAAAGAQVVANLNASPYHRGKRDDREQWARHHAASAGTPVLYVNQVGGQDEVVFDGDSFVALPDGSIACRGAVAAEDLVVLDLDVAAGTATPVSTPRPRPDEHGEVWAALVLATRDYVRKNGFERVWIALSGGIDSAVTAALAVDALGPDAVTGVALPSPHSSDHSVEDAHALAANLGITCHELAIGPAMDAIEGQLGDLLPDEPGLAHENLQSRIRGTTMMALSNAHGGLVLTTGNKSEYAVGYATLYGDMNGAFGPLKDVAKTLVWDLARWRNRDGEVVPTRTITKPPSAELRPGQLDEDSLPAYEVLDAILELLVEQDRSIAETVAAGHDEGVVREVARMVDRAEFKRRQSAPGPKITVRAFGRDRRVPITNAWRG